MQKLVYVMGGLILALVIVGLILPQRAQVTATVEIDARPATVFALANDFRRMRLWLPWLESDPDARVIFTGAPRGVGAGMTWDGLILGSGSQVITESRPFEYIETAINPGEPGSARSWFKFSASGRSTVVRWTFETDHGYNLVGRYAALLVNGLIRRDYEAGLQALAHLAESLPAADFSNLDIDRLRVEARDAAILTGSSRPDPASMSTALGEAYFRILQFIDDRGLTEAGPPMMISRSYDGRKLHFDAAIPVHGVTEAAPRADGGVRLGRSYAGHALRVVHRGSYDELVSTHRKIDAYLAALGIERNGDYWESYASDPAHVPEAARLTYVFYPIRE